MGDFDSFYVSPDLFVFSGAVRLSYSTFSSFSELHSALAAFFEEQGGISWLIQVHLLDNAEHKCNMEGITYTVKPLDSVDILHRYEIVIIRTL